MNEARLELELDLIIYCFTFFKKIFWMLVDFTS